VDIESAIPAFPSSDVLVRPAMVAVADGRVIGYEKALSPA